MNRLEQKLRQEIGLDPAAIGRAVFERTVRRRLTTLGLAREIKPSERTGASVSAISRAEDGLSEYLQLLESSATEREELIEALVVKETWFFRDREPFHAFAQLAREWLVQHPGETLRALSVPCATGEEPYSLAMALLDAHVPPERFTIDAADLSVRALAQARQAVYGKNSFRGADLGFRDRHFTAVPCLPDRPAGGYALNPQVRERVRFYAANLLGADFMRGAKPWDFVFCRHLLIYFDRATQARALAKLADLLPPRGWLFVGPAEMPLATAHGFVSAKLPMAFACQKAESPAATGTPDAGQRLPVSSLKTNRVESPISHLLKPTEDLATPSAAPAALRWQGRIEDGRSKMAPVHPPSSVLHPLPVTSSLLLARELADAGRHEDAVAHCEAHLRQQGPSAEAYYLLGLIGEARGETQAINYYRKALYLAPNHHEALRQISLLLEKNGDPDGARIFRHRAERVQPKI